MSLQPVAAALQGHTDLYNVQEIMLINFSQCLLSTSHNPNLHYLLSFESFASVSSLTTSWVSSCAVHHPCTLNSLFLLHATSIGILAPGCRSSFISRHTDPDCTGEPSREGDVCLCPWTVSCLVIDNALKARGQEQCESISL